MEGVDGTSGGDPLNIENNDNLPTSSTISPSVSTVYVTIPQSGTIVSSAKGVSRIFFCRSINKFYGCMVYCGRFITLKP